MNPDGPAGTDEATGSDGPVRPGRVLRVEQLGKRERYNLTTSLVVPRPIGWLSTRSPDGAHNVAPFSYFNVVSSSPIILSVSIGARRGGTKDTLNNIRATGEFCINVVTEKHLHAMNESAGDHPPHIDEFGVAGIRAAQADSVDAPYVADCPAVFECRLHREVELPEAAAVLILADVQAIRLTDEVLFDPETYHVDPRTLRPVARLGGEMYSLLGEIPVLPRPRVG